jgi:hypothetical protein
VIHERAGRNRVLIAPMEAVVQPHGDDAVGRLAAFLHVDPLALAGSFAQAGLTKERIDEQGFLFGRVLCDQLRDSGTLPRLRPMR